MNQNVEHMFNVTFEKPAADVRKRVDTKASQIKAKIEERQARIAKLRKEYDIDDAAMVQLLQALRRDEQLHGSGIGTYSYSSASNAQVAHGSSKTEMTIGAGAVKNLMTEGDAIDSERAHVRKLELLSRNVEDRPNYGIASYNGSESERPVKGIALSYEELEFLGY